MATFKNALAAESDWQDPVAPIVDELERRRARAKHLPLVHSAKLGPVSNDARFSAAPVRLASTARTRARVCSSHLLVELMRLAGVSSLDVAAAVDLSDKRVREMCAGQRPVALEHVLLMVERLPSVRAVFQKMVLEMVTK